MPSRLIFIDCIIMIIIFATIDLADYFAIIFIADY